MTLIENSYTLDGSYIRFKFKGVVDDRIATDEISKVTYYTSDTEAKIIHRNTNSLAFNKRIYIYNIDNLISSYQTDYYANNLLIIIRFFRVYRFYYLWNCPSLFFYKSVH